MATHSCSFGETQGWQSLVGCPLWGRKESDTTEATWRQQQRKFIAPARLLGFQFSPSIQLCQVGFLKPLLNPYSVEELTELLFQR